MKKHLTIQLSSVLALPLILGQFILFSFNTYNVDMPHYIIRYQNIARYGPRYFGNLVDIVFNYLMSFFQRFSLNYQDFLLFCGVLIFGLLLSVCRYYKVNQFAFFFFFFITTFFVEAVILRQFFASALVTFAYTLDRFSRRSKAYSLLIIIVLVVACGIHITSFLALFYYFFKDWPIRRLVTVSLFGTMVSFPFIGVILPRLTSLLGAKFALYTSETDGGLISFLAKVIFLLTTTLLFHLIVSYMVANREVFTEKQFKLAELSLKVTFLNYIFLPLMRIDISFERLLIVPIFMYLLVIASLFNGQLRVSQKKIAIFSLCVVWSLLAYRIFVYSDRLGTVEALFANNLLW